MGREYTTLLRALHKDNGLKAWSLILTFFGDAIVPRGGAVSAATLQTVLEKTGVCAGTVRTAVSRLASDSWIEREKAGRVSFYHLSATGRELFAEAEQQIYAKPTRTAPASDKAQQYLLAVRNPHNQQCLKELQAKHRYFKINATTLLFAAADPALHKALSSADALLFQGSLQRVPDWLKQQLGSTDIAKRYRRIQKRFNTIDRKPPGDPLTALATRCLLIHEWRRLLLRAPLVDQRLLPADWPHDECHQFVADLYGKLNSDAERWLDESATGPLGPLQIHTTAYQRFR